MGAFSVVRNGLAVLASMALLEVFIEEFKNKNSSEQQEIESEQQETESEQQNIEDKVEIEYPPQIKDALERAKQQKMELDTLMNLTDMVAKELAEMKNKLNEMTKEFGKEN